MFWVFCFRFGGVMSVYIIAAFLSSSLSCAVLTRFYQPGSTANLQVEDFLNGGGDDAGLSF